jgi:hypothetical protein
VQEARPLEFAHFGEGAGKGGVDDVLPVRVGVVIFMQHFF